MDEFLSAIYEFIPSIYFLDSSCVLRSLSVSCYSLNSKSKAY